MIDISTTQLGAVDLGGLLAQGGPFGDENWIRILVPALIFGFWIIRGIMQALSGAAKRAAGEGGEPRKRLRDFLEEVRDEAERKQREARGEDPDLDWEPVEEQPRRVEIDERREEFKRRQAERKAELERRRREARAELRRQAEERHGHIEPEPESEPEVHSVGDRRLESSLSTHQLQSSLSSRAIDTELDERHVGRFHTMSSAPVVKRDRAKLRSLGGVLGGVTPRDLLLAQIILGKPKSQRQPGER